MTRRERHRAALRARLSFQIYRLRYLIGFTAIGLLSIALEIAIVRFAAPQAWSWSARACFGFAFGLLFSFALNTLVNFRVPRRAYWRTFFWFTVVSVSSFALNMAVVVLLRHLLQAEYAWPRLLSAGCLFSIAYAFHRRYTFVQARSFGLALYASSDEDVGRAYDLLGPNCDHLHIDLVDETMRPDAAAVDLSRIDEARELWPLAPICLHVMSQRPSDWVEAAIDRVDWLLLHVNTGSNLMDLIFRCRQSRKKVGVVWQRGIAPREFLPYLPHVDFVMVLGIDAPGHSGQPVLSEALEAAAVFESLRSRYHYEMMFDGGVTIENVALIPARYIVSASAVLRAPRPAAAAFRLRTAAHLVG